MAEAAASRYLPLMVDAALTPSVRVTVMPAGQKPGMSNMPFINGRGALADAASLIDAFGDDAGFEAASRAEHSRDAGNVRRFCHWRQIERVIASLACDQVRGTIH